MTTDDIFGTTPTFPVSLFARKHDVVPKSARWTFPELRDALTTFSVREDKDGSLWSPTRYDGLRGKADAVEITCLVLDFDKGHAPEDFLESELWRRYSFVAHSTYSHTPDHPKFRAAFPFAMPCPAKPGEQEAIWKRLYTAFSDLFGGGVVDAVDDTARMFWLPTAQPGAPSWAVANEGELLDWREFLADIAPPEPQQDEEDPEKPPPVPTDGSRVGDEFNERGTWEEVLEPAGWQKTGRRYGKMDLWQRPGEDPRDDHCARTGVGNAGDRFVCWSTSVSEFEPNRAYTKFAAYCYLHHKGDFKAAAKALAGKYGTPRVPPAPSHTERRQMIEPSESGLPVIETLDRELRDLTDDALGALREANKPAYLFVRDGILVRVEGNEEGEHVIRPLNNKALRGVLARSADWTAFRAKGPVHVAPPMDVVDDILSLGVPPPGVPRLGGISSAPVVAPGGSIRRKAGYDEVSRWYITDDIEIEKWEGGGVAAAKWLMDELLADFPFADQASKANALGLVLLPYLRPLIDEPTPLHLVDAPTPGTGKSLLVKAALLPALGAAPAATPVPDKEAEFQKLLFSLLLDGKQVIFLDNLDRLLKSGALAALLTTGSMTDRILGLSQTPTVKVRCVLAATANNGALSEDIARRSVWIRLDARMEDPEKRTQFKHPRILSWARDNRAQIVSAALGMIEHWFAIGQPKPTARKGSFEVWCEVVGGVLAACQVEGFLANDKDLKMSANETDGAWRAFYAAWYEEFAGSDVSIKDLRQLAEQKELLDFVFAKSATERGKATAFGRALSAQVGRVLSGLSPAKSTARDGHSRFKLLESSGQVDLNLYPTRADAHTHTHTHTHIHAEGGVEVHLSTEQVQNGSELSDESPLEEEEGWFL
jgi:hypothetical protein